MDVQPAAGLTGEGFRHEARVHAFGSRDRPHGPAQLAEHLRVPAAVPGYRCQHVGEGRREGVRVAVGESVSHRVRRVTENVDELHGGASWRARGEQALRLTQGKTLTDGVAAQIDNEGVDVGGVGVTLEIVLELSRPCTHVPNLV